MRSVLDDDSKPAQEQLAIYIQKQPPEFTDFLNFFELVAYMGSQKTLSESDVEALLGYYLQLLTDKSNLRDYIRDRKNSFENLNELLEKRETHRA